MTGPEQGFLLLTSTLGDPARKPLTVAQFRTLASRVRSRTSSGAGEQLTPEIIGALGYDRAFSQRVMDLLSQTDVLEYYLKKGRKQGCVPITRISPDYPARIRNILGLDSPGCLWAKGNVQLLQGQKLALVGSRILNPENAVFAGEVGRQAALQGYTLVSGNARGADRTAQQACLEQGGNVISIVADALEAHPAQENILYLSEDSFDAPFTPARAHSRNRLIHCLAARTFVAQSRLNRGGTWTGTVKNLRSCWSQVFCFRDGSDAARELCQMGGLPIGLEELNQISALEDGAAGFIE